MPTLQQDTHHQRWPDVSHPLAYWYVKNGHWYIRLHTCILAYSIFIYLSCLSLFQVRNLTLVTCVERALQLQATTTITSEATVAKSHTGEAPTSNPDYPIIIVDSCFLAVQNSSIGDLVTHSLTDTTFTFDIQRATPETSDL